MYCFLLLLFFNKKKSHQLIFFNNEFTILSIVVPSSGFYVAMLLQISLHFQIASLKLFNFGEGENKWVVTIIIRRLKVCE